VIGRPGGRLHDDDIEVACRFFTDIVEQPSRFVVLHLLRVVGKCGGVIQGEFLVFEVFPPEAGVREGGVLPNRLPDPLMLIR
jgi:hypothetical protein